MKIRRYLICFWIPILKKPSRSCFLRGARLFPLQRAAVYRAPAMSAALSYFDGYTTRCLPANLLQAQRDYFGAHTYRRLDASADQVFHTNWTGHGGSTAAGTYNA